MNCFLNTLTSPACLFFRAFSLRLRSLWTAFFAILKDIAGREKETQNNFCDLFCFLVLKPNVAVSIYLTSKCLKNSKN